MLDGQNSIEVLVIPENQHCGQLADIQKAELCPAGSLLCCLGVSGQLLVWDPGDREAPPAASDGCFVDFCWEEATTSILGVSSFNLLAVGSQGDLTLFEAEAEQSTPVSLLTVQKCNVDNLLEIVKESDKSVCELVSVQVLSFMANQCCVLVNSDWILQLQWEQASQEPKKISCCRIQLTTSDRHTAVHHCVFAETLFVLSSSGLIYVYAITDGSLLASIDIPSYLSSGWPDGGLTSSSLSSSSSFCLFHVSADLCTAVAVTQSHAAVTVNLNHYFREHPEHLHCVGPKSPSSLQPKDPGDQDALSSSSSSFAAVGSPFSDNRAWDTCLASMYARAQQAAYPSSPSKSAGIPWFHSLPRLPSHPAARSSHSRVPPSGAIVTFSVPDSSTPSLLAVSEFSALLTFVAPGNTHTTVALWEMESGRMSYHQAEGTAVPVQHSGERQHRLLLKKSGVFQIVFSMSQQDLLSKLMLFGSAATVDTVCHLNSWGHCSIPFHALQTGLKNRQLDTVDLYLKSKENVLNPSATAGFSEQLANSKPSLKDSVQELLPALDLLCSAVRELSSEAQSRQFSEQLLNLTMSFINTQLRSVLLWSHYEQSDVQSNVEVLGKYVTELRGYMKRFPWASGDSTSDASAPLQGAKSDEWEQLSTEEVIHQSILTNQIPRAQAVMWRQNRPEKQLAALRMVGLRQVLLCLQCKDLKSAKKFLTNMGLSVKKELHNICLYTNNKGLRELLVEDLSKHSSLTEEELEGVSFICEIEKLGLLPAVSCPANPLSQRLPQMIHKELDGEEVVKELVGQSSKEEGELWRNLRLDWVKTWDQSCQTAVRLSRLQHIELSCCDPALLWHYLTAFHHHQKVVDWIHNQRTFGSPCWPDITPEMVNNNTVCSIFFKENILDLLARKGVFIPDEMSDLEQLLWRLAQGAGLMTSSPPVSQYCSPLCLNLHSVFIALCLEHNLQYLLYTYLEHYRLTPRNCPLLTDQNLLGSHPWFEMMVKTQEITRDLSEPEPMFQASLTSAQVLLPGSLASLSSLLFEGHSLLALASIMFAHGGIDKVVAQGQSSTCLEGTVDPQLLKMALAPHYKLRAALFPSANGSFSDIFIYHLLQSLHPLDPSRLFSWQTANPLNCTETAELPHFSSSHLVGKFAIIENLDFLYYIHHGRPSFAYGNFLIQQLGVCSDVQLLLQKVWLQVYRLALKCFSKPSVTSSAVCFCELLGICSLKLRVDIRALNTILQHWNQLDRLTPTQNLRTLMSKAVKLVNGEPGAAAELLCYLEAAVADSLEQRGISRSSFEAAQQWALPVQFCQLHSLELSLIYPSHCAEDRQFVHFLLFVQLHNFPPQQVRSLVGLFDPVLQVHLSLAFQDLQVHNQTSRDPQEQLGFLRTDVVAGGSEHGGELFQVLLQSQEKQVSWRFLLHEAIVQHCPMLAVLAACLQGTDLLSCLCVWMLTSVVDTTTEEATSHLTEAPQDHEWTLHDLSVIWKMLLRQGHTWVLLRGFELFQQDCPLVLVLRMFELCCDYRKFTEAKTKLLDFQRTLIALRNCGPEAADSLPLQWVESQASVLLLTMLLRCSSQYDLHQLLQLLADVDKLLKSNGPDFRKLSQLSQLLQGSGVTLSQSLLQCISPSVQQEEFQLIVDALQTGGCYSQARQVAVLAGLPVHRLLMSQLLQEVNFHKSKWRWRRLETRVAFWKKCHRRLKADSTEPESAAQFFLSQTEAAAGPDGDQAQTNVLDIQECCLLLQLTAHWLSLLTPVPVDELQRLEKKLWFCQVQKHILTTTIEEKSMFNLLPPAITPETNEYEIFMKEFSFSNIADLNMEKYLSLEGFPEKPEELDTESDLSSEERRVLAILIDQLLDKGSIHEASRVCRYFNMHNPDVWLVLCCHALACGFLVPEPQGQTTEPAETKALTQSPSLSSLSSFVMVPLHEDAVTVQIQKRVDQCRHGSSYCKQVLSLYQLSKELQCLFSHISREEPHSVLEKLLLLVQPDRFRMAKTFIKTQGLSADSVAELVSNAVVQGLLAATQELQSGERLIFRPSEGQESLIQLIRLCEDPNIVGLKLLENLNSVPLRDLNSIVELLIVAHSCFSLTCNMEGIVRVLQAARHLSHTYLAPGEHYSLLVRLLTGIGRYNEMTYIFDLLHQNHCFEMLLRKKVDRDIGQSSSLKTSLLDYIKRCLPADSEKHNMVALCFSMRREIGENHEIAARTQLKMIESQDWVVNPDLKNSLVKVLGLLKDAAESFSKDSCVHQAGRCVRAAKLITLQLHLLNQGSNLRIINLKPAEMHSAILALPQCYQVFVVAEAYSYSPDWAEILYQKVALKGHFAYLEELKCHLPLTSALFEDIFRKLDSIPSSVCSNVKRLLNHCDDVYTRYRLAYQQNLYDVTKTLLQDNKTSSYMNDRLASKAFI
ncbi:PREDICTED: spatacsin isoform X1 [Poecilia mexicana]|uniref:Spatacsin C-terminal domain-containing protein n=1 Tax=Poecilia mexicana TaxID=48701 RepID=A0A3B3XVE9_9TELE|nr:PREDICTED: spatacsin isoform X1 [Poecilia mexicana]